MAWLMILFAYPLPFLIVWLGEKTSEDEMDISFFHFWKFIPFVNWLVVAALVVFYFEEWKRKK